jgi:hypothetical protein
MYKIPGGQQITGIALYFIFRQTQVIHEFPVLKQKNGRIFHILKNKTDIIRNLFESIEI